MTTQFGHEWPADRHATILRMLMDSKTMIQHKEGRDLFKLCRPYVKDTVWENILFPRSKTREDVKAEKLFEWIFEEKAKCAKWRELLKTIKD